MAAGDGQLTGLAGGGGQTAVANNIRYQPSPRLSRQLDKKTAARESLLATLQDRTAPLQAPLPRIRLSGRALTELGLMSAKRNIISGGENGPPVDTNGTTLPAGAPPGRLGLQQRPLLSAADGGKIGMLGGKAGGNNNNNRGVMCMVYEELQPPKELPENDWSTPRDLEEFRRSPDLNVTVRGRSGRVELDRGERGGCEGRLDYAQMPVTLTQLHKIMSGKKNKYNITNDNGEGNVGNGNRKVKSHYTVPISGPSTDQRCETGHTEPVVLPSQQRTKNDMLNKNKSSNIRISIKRDNRGITPAVKLTMKVTLPNINQPPTTASSALVVKRRQRLPAFVSNSRQRTLLRINPNNGGADYNPVAPSVTYPDDCYEEETRNHASLAPVILRKLEFTQMRPVDLTRKWLVDNPVEDLDLEPVPTPTPSPPLQQSPSLTPHSTTANSTKDDVQPPDTPGRRIIKMKLKPKSEEVSQTSGKTLMPSLTSKLGSTSTKPTTKRIRLVSTKASHLTSVPAISPKPQQQVARVKETAL